MIKITPISLKYKYQPFFDNGSNSTKKTNNYKTDSFINKNKKEIAFGASNDSLDFEQLDNNSQNQQQIQTLLDKTVTEFKKYGHYDDNLHARSLDELTTQLSNVTKKDNIIRGTLPNGMRRKIELEENRISNVQDFGFDGDYFLYSCFDKNSKLYAMDARKKVSNNTSISFYSKNDNLTRLSLLYEKKSCELTKNSDITIKLNPVNKDDKLDNKNSSDNSKSEVVKDVKKISNNSLNKQQPQNEKPVKKDNKPYINEPFDDSEFIATLGIDKLEGNMLNQKQVQKILDGAVLAFRKFDHYDDNLHAKSLEELTAQLSIVTDEKFDNAVKTRIIEGILPNGATRMIRAERDRIVEVFYRSKDGDYLWTYFDKNSKLWGIDSNEKSFGNGHNFVFWLTSKGSLMRFSFFYKKGYLSFRPESNTKIELTPIKKSN